MSERKKLILTRVDRTDDSISSDSEINIVENCSIGRGTQQFPFVNSKKISRKHAKLEFSQDGNVVLKSTCNLPTYYWSAEGSDEKDAKPKTLIQEDFVELKSGDKFGFLLDSYIFSVNMSPAGTERTRRSSTPTLKIVDYEHERSTSPTLPLNDSEDCFNADSDTEPDSDHEWEKVKCAEIDAIKNEDLESNKVNDSLAKPSVIPKPSSVPKIMDDDEPKLSPLKRKRILPGWMITLSKNTKQLPEPPSKKSKPTAEVETKKSRSSQNSRSPPKRTNSRADSKRSNQRSTRRSSRKEEYEDEDDDEVDLDDDDDDDSFTGSSPSRRRQRRAAAVRVSSYAEDNFVVNDSEFSESDEEAKPKKRRKTESDEEYETDVLAAESASEYEVDKDEKRAHNNSHKVSNRRQSSSQRNANSSRRPSRSRRSRVVVSSDDEEDETDEDDEPLSVRKQTPVDSKTTVKKSPPKTEKPSDTSVKKREFCVYGKKCYRKNPAHRKEISHPGDSDWESESERDAKLNSNVSDNTNDADDDSRPECEHGKGCFRKNPDHLKSFKHTVTKRNPAKKSYRDLEDEGSDNSAEENDAEGSDAASECTKEDEDWEPSDDDGNKKKRSSRNRKTKTKKRA